MNKQLFSFLSFSDCIRRVYRRASAIISLTCSCYLSCMLLLNCFKKDRMLFRQHFYKTLHLIIDNIKSQMTQIVNLTKRLRNLVRTQSVLYAQRFNIMKELQSASSQLNSSIVHLTRLYRYASIFPKWAQNVVPFLDKHTELKGWELNYWRFRANLVYDILSKKAADQFLIFMNQHNYVDSDLVLLSTLLTYPQSLKKYKGMMENIMQIIAENIHILPINSFKEIIENLIVGIPNQAVGVQTAVQNYVNANINKFKLSQCGPILHLTDLEAFKAENRLQIIDPRVIYWRRINALLCINRTLLENNMLNQTFVHQILPRVVFDDISFVITRKQRHDSRNIYNFFQGMTNFKKDPSVKAKRMKQLLIMSTSLHYLTKHTPFRGALLQQANRIIKEDPDIGSLIPIMHHCQTNKIRVNLETFQNIKDKLQDFLQKMKDPQQLGDNMYNLLYCLLRICNYTPELKQYIPRFDVPGQISPAVRIELIKSITINRQFCKLLPKICDFYIKAMRKEDSKLTIDIMYLEKLELYTGRRSKLLFVTSKRAHKSALSKTQFAIQKNIKDNYPYLQIMRKYIHFGYEIDFVLKNKNNKTLYLDLHGPSHFYINAINTINPQTLSKQNLMKQICNYESLFMSKDETTQDLKSKLRKIINKHFGEQKVEKKILQKPEDKIQK